MTFYNAFLNTLKNQKDECEYISMLHVKAHANIGGCAHLCFTEVVIVLKLSSSFLCGKQ